MPQQVQCPKCAKSVSVGDQAAGGRVMCPHCNQSFLAPGFSASSNDDDDWLSLDDPSPSESGVSPSPPTHANPPKDSTVPKVESKRSGKPPASSSSAEKPKRKAPSAGGEKSKPASDKKLDDLSVFGSALDEFTSGIEPLPGSSGSSQSTPSTATPANPSSLSGQSDPFGDLPEMAMADLPDAPATPITSSDSLPSSPPVPAPAKPTAPRAEPVEYATEYRVTCNLCGTILYAKASQQGKHITCSDCHAKVKVPPPPKIKKKPKIDIENAQTFDFEQPAPKARTQDPYQKSAQELLDEAAKEPTPYSATNPDNPDVREWARDVFGIFLDPGVLARWIGLSIVGAIPAFIALWSESAVLITALHIGGALLAAMAAVYGFAILVSVANRRGSVKNWPESNLGDWADDLLLAVCAVAFSGGPIWLLVVITSGFSLLGVAATLLSIFAFFPFVMLSMLDMRSIFAPFSPEVARSVTRCQEAWGAMYLSAGLLFVGLFIVIAVLATASAAAGAVIATFACVAVAFSYFGLVGRLAYQIGQEVSEPVAAADGDSDQPETAPSPKPQ